MIGSLGNVSDKEPWVKILQSPQDLLIEYGFKYEIIHTFVHVHAMVSNPAWDATFFTTISPCHTIVRH